MIAVGDRLPEVDFTVMGPERPAKRSVAELCDGRTIVLFGLPGAFTPTCHLNHLPGFIDCADAIKDLGIDDIAVVSVNDVYVMRAWKEATKAQDRVTFLADGSAEFAQACGLDVDLSAHGMGIRCQRFSMIVDNGVVRAFNLEEKGGGAKRTGAVAIIEQLQAMKG